MHYQFFLQVGKNKKSNNQTRICLSTFHRCTCLQLSLYSLIHNLISCWCLDYLPRKIDYIFFPFCTKHKKKLNLLTSSSWMVERNRKKTLNDEKWYPLTALNYFGFSGCQSSYHINQNISYSEFQTQYIIIFTVNMRITILIMLTFSDSQLCLWALFFAISYILRNKTHSSNSCGRYLWWQ